MNLQNISMTKDTGRSSGAQGCHNPSRLLKKKKCICIYMLKYYYVTNFVPWLEVSKRLSILDKSICLPGDHFSSNFLGLQAMLDKIVFVFFSFFLSLFIYLDSYSH